MAPRPHIRTALRSRPCGRILAGPSVVSLLSHPRLEPCAAAAQHRPPGNPPTWEVDHVPPHRTRPPAAAARRHGTAGGPRSGHSRVRRADPAGGARDGRSGGGDEGLPHRRGQGARRRDRRQDQGGGEEGAVLERERPRRTGAVHSARMSVALGPAGPVLAELAPLGSHFRGRDETFRTSSLWLPPWTAPP